MKAKRRLNWLRLLSVCAIAIIIGASYFVQYCEASRDVSDEVIVKLHRRPVLTGVDGSLVARRYGGTLSKKIPNH